MTNKTLPKKVKKSNIDFMILNIHMDIMLKIIEKILTKQLILLSLHFKGQIIIKVQELIHIIATFLISINKTKLQTKIKLGINT